MSPEERRRLALAIVITLVALPALWLMQKDDEAPGNPSLAAAGAPAPGSSSDGSSDTTDPPPPPYLEGPSGNSDTQVDSSVVIATSPPAAGAQLSGTATFKRFDATMFPAGSCQVHDAPIGVLITIRNVDNDRTATCTNISTRSGSSGQIAIIDTAVFVQIADLVDAPLPVELTW